MKKGNGWQAGKTAWGRLNRVKGLTCEIEANSGRGGAEIHFASTGGQASAIGNKRTGEKSAKRIALENGAPIIKAAGAQWQDLHSGDCLKEGMRIRAE